MQNWSFAWHILETNLDRGLHKQLLSQRNVKCGLPFTCLMVFGQARVNSACVSLFVFITLVPNTDQLKMWQGAKLIKCGRR